MIFHVSVNLKNVTRGFWKKTTEGERGMRTSLNPPLEFSPLLCKDAHRCSEISFSFFKTGPVFHLFCFHSLIKNVSSSADDLINNMQLNWPQMIWFFFSKGCGIKEPMKDVRMFAVSGKWNWCVCVFGCVSDVHTKYHLTDSVFH